MALKDRILEARQKLGITQAEMATRMGITPQAVNQWESGDTEPRDLGRIVKLADVLEVSLDYLIKGSGGAGDHGSGVGSYRVPLLNRVAAGRWNDVISPTELPPDTRFFELSLKPKGYAIALELDGESMLPEYRPRDIIIIDTGLEPTPGDPVVAVLDVSEEATFKKFRLRGYDPNNRPIIDLVPLNPDYPTLTIDSDHPGRIIGTLIEHRRVWHRRSSAA